MTESDIQQFIQADGPVHNCILMRNNCGALKDATGRWVFYGLGNISKKRSEEIKSSDLIGITTITITPEMVGRQIGVFTAVECKEPGWKPTGKDKRERAQYSFLDWVYHKGGYAGFADSVEAFRRIIGK